MKKQYYIVLAIGVVAVSFAAIFIRLADAPSLVIAAWRLILAALLILPFAIIRNRKEITGLNRKQWLLTAGAGAFLALHFGFWIASLSYTSVATSAILVTANPIFVAFASYLLFQETITRRTIVGVVISIAGAVIIGLVNWRLGPNPLLGALLALLGALTVAGYLLIGRRLRRNIGLVTYSSLTYSIAAILLLIAVFISGYSLTGYSGNTWLMFFLLAVVPQLIGHTSLNHALKYVPATMVTVAVLGEPVITTLLAIFILGELPTVMEIVGGVLILGGIFLAFKDD